MGRALLFLTGGMLIIFGMVQISITERQQVLPERTVNYYNDQQAQGVAHSLIDLAVAEIQRNVGWSGTLEFDDFMGGSGFVEAHDMNSTNMPDSVYVQNWDEFKILLYSELEYEDQVLKTEVLMERKPYTRYSYFTEIEPNNIYFFSGDELSGPVHTNGTMNIAGEPVFNGMVTSPNNWQGRTGSSNNPQFLGGSDFSVQEKESPRLEDMDEIRSTAQSGGLYYEDPINVQFNGDNTITITENPYTSSSQTETFSINEFNGVISSTEHVQTKGAVNGQITLHSKKDIEIMGDIWYTDNPEDNPSSTDILGIISEKNVIVDDDAHKDNGSTDLTIHASIIALDESFVVEDYDRGWARGELNLLGGIVQYRRGAVGTFSGNSVASGFSKSYNYDNRLLNLYPPSVPREKIFSVKYWRDRSL